MNTKKKTVSHISGAKVTAESLAAEVMEIDAQIKTLASTRDEKVATLIQLVGSLPTEGLRSFAVGAFIVKVRARINRRLNATKVAKAVAELLPKHVADRVFPVKRSLSMRELHWLEDNDQKSYRVVRKTFVAGAGKPTVSVEVA